MADHRISKRDHRIASAPPAYLFEKVVHLLPCRQLGRFLLLCAQQSTGRQQSSSAQRNHMSRRRHHPCRTCISSSDVSSSASGETAFAADRMCIPRTLVPPEKSPCRAPPPPRRDTSGGSRVLQNSASSAFLRGAVGKKGSGRDEQGPLCRYRAEDAAEAASEAERGERRVGMEPLQIGRLPPPHCGAAGRLARRSFGHTGAAAGDVPCDVCTLHGNHGWRQMETLPKSISAAISPRRTLTSHEVTFLLTPRSSSTSLLLLPFFPSDPLPFCRPDEVQAGPHRPRRCHGHPPPRCHHPPRRFLLRARPDRGRPAVQQGTRCLTISIVFSSSFTPLLHQSAPQGAAPRRGPRRVRAFPPLLPLAIGTDAGALCFRGLVLEHATHQPRQAVSGRPSLSRRRPHVHPLPDQPADDQVSGMHCCTLLAADG